MKTFRIAIILAMMTAPMISSAHGGVEKSAGDITVHINQTPLSPLVGEEVRINFVLEDSDGIKLRNSPVKLTLIDTFFDDATQDQVILTQTKTTDNNGSFDFTHTFDKENYFDLDLAFTDPTTREELNTGLLIQPRTRPSLTKLVWANVLILIIFLIVGYRLALKPTS